MQFILLLAAAIGLSSCGNYFHNAIQAPAFPQELIWLFTSSSGEHPEGRTTSESEIFTGVYGGTNQDEAVAVLTKDDGGYLVAGNTRSTGAGGYDIILLDLDRFGNCTTQVTLGGTEDDRARTIRETSDGGYLLLGETFSFGKGDADIWVVKLNETLGIEWERAFGGAGTDTPGGIVERDDGTILVAGSTKSYGKGMYDLWLLKLNALGGLEWEMTQGNETNDVAEGIVPIADGSYTIFGQSDCAVAGRYAAFFYNVDQWGDINYSITLRGPQNTLCRAFMQTDDGGFMAVMDSNSFLNMNYSIWAVKIDGVTRNVAWQRAINGENNAYGRAVINGTGGSVMIGGSTNSFGAGNFDFWLLELDGDGEIVTQKTFGMDGLDYLNDVRENGKGGHVIAGYSSSYGNSSYELCVMSTGIGYSVEGSVIQVSDSSAISVVTNGTKGEAGFMVENNTHGVDATVTNAVVGEGGLVGMFY
jgi:hypothetical protein